MTDTVWQDGDISVSTYIGPVAIATGARTRVQIYVSGPNDGWRMITMSLPQWESLCAAVRDLGTNPHHAPPVKASHGPGT